MLIKLILNTRIQIQFLIANKIDENPKFPNEKQCQKSLINEQKEKQNKIVFLTNK